MTQPPSTTQASRVRVVLYVALALSAATALLGMDELERQVRQGTLPPVARWFPGLTFALALALYAVDRVLLVKNRHYPSGKAFFQVAAGMAVFATLLPGPVMTAVDQDAPQDVLLALLAHQDPRVRALACEVAGLRGGPTHLAVVQRLTRDQDATVAQAAQAALQRRTTAALVAPMVDAGAGRLAP